MRKKNKEGGFLLLEALMALGILAGGVTWIFQSYASSLRAARLSGERLQAALALEEKIWAWEKAKGPREPVRVEEAMPWGPVVFEAARLPGAEDAPASWSLSLTWGPEQRERFSAPACPEVL